MTETETAIYYDRYVDATSGIIAKILKLTLFLICFARVAYFRVLYVSSYELLEGDTFAIITV
jgi:hypothetical protein